jgi:uncharacterized protein (DUF924 family)
MPSPSTPSASGSDAWIGEVIDFWFRALPREAWFRKDADVDRKIRDRFLALYDELAVCTADNLSASADKALAAVIVLDQFPRNMFRDTANAFATDGLALAIARQAIASGLDQELPAEQRIFLYLPFEHSEALADQLRCIDLTEKLGEAEYARYARLHHDVIARFGRFPHRNALLGRASTPDEEAFLKEPGSRF